MGQPSPGIGDFASYGIPSFGNAMGLPGTTLPGTGGFLNTFLSGGNTPQQQGQGIGPPPDFQPYTTSPGLMPGDPSAFSSSFDQTQPGAAEQYWKDNAARVAPGGVSSGAYNPAGTMPQQAEQYWNKVVGQTAPQYAEGQYGQTKAALSGPSQSQTFGGRAQPNVWGPSASETFFQTASNDPAANPRNAQSVFDSFRGGPPGLDPYFDRAAQKTTADVNRALAAQGLLGSAFGASEAGDALSNLRAEQALKEGEYRLSEAQTAGQLARGADVGGLEGLQTRANMAGNATDAMLGRMGLGQGIAGQIDEQTLRRLGLLGDMSGMVDQTALQDMATRGNLAQNAQALGLNRENSAFSNAMGLDQLDISKLLAGGQLAGQAQNMQAGRTQGMLDNVYRQQMAALAAFSPYYMGSIGADQQLMDASMAAELGLAQNAASQGYRAQERLKEDPKWAVGLFGDLMGGMSGLGGMF